MGKIEAKNPATRRARSRTLRRVYVGPSSSGLRGVATNGINNEGHDILLLCLPACLQGNRRFPSSDDDLGTRSLVYTYKNYLSIISKLSPHLLHFPLSSNLSTTYPVLLIFNSLHFEQKVFSKLSPGKFPE